MTYNQLVNCNSIYEQWKDQLVDIPENNKIKVAILMDNQGKIPNPELAHLIPEIYKNFIGFDIVNIQPMIGPQSTLYYTRYKTNELCDIPTNPELEQYSREIHAVTRRTQPRILKSEISASQIADVMLNEIITDIKNNVGTIKTSKFASISKDQVHADISHVSGIIYKKTLRGKANWIMMNPTFALKLAIMSLNTDTCYKLPSFGTQDVYLMPTFPHNEILVGCYSEEEMLDAYFYCPYNINILEDSINGDSILLRTGKHLATGGHKYYGKIVYA